MHNAASHHIKQNQPENMKGENDSDNLDEHHEDGENLPRMRHIEEDAEDIERQQGQNHATDGLDDDLLEIAGHILQVVGLQRSGSQAQHESQHERGHHIHQRRNLHAEIRFYALRLRDFFQWYS